MPKRVAPVIALAALLLAGCGQKGPLYLPDRNGTVVSSPAATAPPAQTQTPAPDSAPSLPAPTQPAPKKDNSEDDSQPPQ
jgi:predicted small lipoprotein YifL